MKKIFLVLTALSLFACNEKKQNDYVSLQGTIANTDINTLTILGKNFKKEINVNEDGTFSDTLKVIQGFHGFNDGKQQSFIYLKNGYDLELNFDAADFPKSVAFNGEGSETNNYLIEKINLVQDEKLNNYDYLIALDESAFEAKMADVKQKFAALLEATPGLEKEVEEMEVKANKDIFEMLQTSYDKDHASMMATQKGAPSPKFNYPDKNGKKVALDDLKGKYVYIDVWATWCAPCKVEIPYLKQIDDEFKGKDIAFVSLSIDKPEHKDKWLKMIEDEKLQGIQIFADNAFNSEFITAYNIKGIPRFILLDKEGNIVDPNAPRPSDPRLKELLTSLEL